VLAIFFEGPIWIAGRPDGGGALRAGSAAGSLVGAADAADAGSLTGAAEGEAEGSLAGAEASAGVAVFAGVSVVVA
jgi:hypothetical protein